MGSLRNYLLLLLLITALPSAAGERVDESMSLGSITHVTIENLRGEVTVIGNNGDTVSVSGELDDKAEGLTFEKSGSRIIIKVEIPNNSHNSWGADGSELTIEMPKHVRVSFKGVSSNINISHFTHGSEIQTVSGDISAKDLMQQIELATVSGNIESKNLSGKLRLSSVSGDIHDRNSTGRAHFKTVSGNLSSSSSANEISANSVSGDIELKLGKVDELIVSTVSGEFESQLSLNENGLVKMSSVSGDLTVDFTNDVQASFNLKTNAGGNIVNRLTSAKATRAKYGPSSKLSFDTGNASGSVRASTVSGRIEVK
ncbi:DUF4097 family beta strand repeat-containing protein [Cognaticolwellia beringensis]|uniref:DUF4097 domain-containing protein n=1 Tax=Cognaticolwellia beringensis TaxID=1967665 RepID=A0A222G8Q3_9GAMM|nr:DUF4097 family beta strand repeat-containing protein [Cognaticolwellia beringensis]ASP48122.1 hypothetical protein B5D82_10335 [Cognaticolwellia beringensis]